ncbi:pentapeptide repeat-containing protein [Clostridium perfringens]|nr:pentapeptide repeat-containing protein [Clostridium perfringens]
MTTTTKNTQIFKYNKAEKRNKNFMYMGFRRANCYNCDFSNSNFSYASFRGAHFKSCDFFECKFDSSEFIGSNLKKSKFKKAKFKNVIFEGVNLDGADFSGATFENVIFLDTDISKTVGMKFTEDEVKIFESMPALEVSEELKAAALEAMNNKYIKKSRVLDTKEGDINPISLLRLLENHKESTLIKGLKLSSEKIDRDFCTLSYIDKAIEKLKNEGLL